MADEPKADELTPEQLQEEQEAKNIGWAPKDQYKGDPDKWVDAHTFIERGQHLMPILRKNNEKLQSDISHVRAENAKLQDLVRASQESIEALQEFNNEETKRQVEKAKREVLAGIKAARKEGDVDTEVDLTAELADLNAAAAEAKNKPAKEKPNGEDKNAGTVHPDFKAWAAENPWYGVDPIKTHLSLGIAEQMRLSGDTRLGRPFMDDVTAEVARREAAMSGKPAGKVEGTRGGAAARPATGKRFSDLPADAQAACHRFASRLVGAGRAYKDMEAWEAAYTTKYLEGEAQ